MDQIREVAAPNRRECRPGARFTYSIRAIARRCAILLPILIAAIIPSASYAASAGCDAVNGGALNGTFTKNGTPNGGFTDQSFDAGDQLNFSYSTTLGGIARFIVRYNDSGTITNVQVVDARSTTAPLSDSSSYTITSSTVVRAYDQAASTDQAGNAAADGSQVTWSVSCNAAGGQPAPVISSVVPGSGPTAGGTSVIITGTNFSGATSVKFGATSASFGVNSGTSITATAPASAAGTVDVTVTTSGGTSATSASDRYTYVAPPVATSFTASAVAYNSGSAGASSLSVTGHATNSPTSYAVGSATTAQGGSVSVNSSGTVSYTPPVGFRGNDSFTFTATNGGGTSAPATVTVPVSSPVFAVSLTGSGGAVGTPLSGVGVAVTGGKAPYTCSTTLASGALPSGVSLNPNCALSGTPATAGTFSFTVTFTDSSTGSGPASGTSGVLALTISNPPPPTAAPASVNVSYNTAKAIDLSASISGMHNSIAVASQPTHGGTSVAGNVVTYTPTSGYFGADSFTYTASGPGGTSSPATVSITVGTPPPPTVAPASATAAFDTAKAIDLSSAITGVHSGIAIVTPASHGNVSVSGDIVTYTPSGYAGADSFTYKATGPGGDSAPATVTLSVTAPTLTLSPATLPSSATAGVAYSVSLAASGGSAPYSYAIAAGSLPTGVTLNASSGLLSGTPIVVGIFNFTVKATDSTAGGSFSVTQPYTLVVAAPSITLSPASLNPSSVGVAFNQSITASGGSGSYTYAVSTGALPLGMTLSHTSGTLSGTPTAGGTYTFVITATDSASFTGSQAYTLTISPATVTIAPGALPGASAGTAYNQTITASGGTASYTFAVTAGSVPPGMVLSPAGVLSGTPTTNGSFSFSVTATDSSTGVGAPYTATQPYTLMVAANPPTVAAKSATVAYDAPTPIDLTNSITGAAHTSIAVAAPPAHGSTSVTGDVVTYTPTAGYYGPDSFTYIASGPGGTSTAATVTITVAIPPIPTVAAASANVGYDTAKAIDLSSSISGVHTSIAVASHPTHGSTSVSGDVVTYTPTTGYYGADSFTYAANGPGGTSTPATVTVTVATPAAPTVAPKSVSVAYDSPANIDLSGSVTGVHDHLTVATPPPHGTTSIAGDVITYTPTAGYYGADSFTYTASGPGGPSTPATISLTVATPAAPVAANKAGIAVPYASSGTAIDLSGSITGVHATIAIGTQPSHGSVTVSGDIATYIPTAGYYGADSFTYTASGPGGTSSPASVSVTVGLPPAPVATDKSGVAVPYDSPGTAIDLSGSVSGVHTSLAVGTAPAHGSVAISGNVATYIPTTGYFGADSFTFAATGPGGTSSAATVSVTVATPSAPVVKAGNGAVASSTQAQKSVDIDLARLITGQYTSIEIAGSPSHGTVTLHGAIGSPSIATYTPVSGFAGTDTFSFVAVGPGGRSAPATITITVTGVVPTAAAKTAKAIDNQLVSIELTDGATEGPFTGATIVSVSPADKTTAKIVEGGSATAHTYRLDVTPAPHFGGTIVVAYTLSNQFGTSAPATVTITVTARPDPSLDPNVRALSDAQAESTRRFAQTQSRNFLQRAEQLHNGGGSSRPRMGITLGSSDSTRASSPGFGLGQREQQDVSDRSRNDVSSDVASSPQTTSSDTAGKSSFSGNNSRGDGERRNGSIAIWSGGQIEIGTRDQTTDRDKISLTTGGLSAGADLKLSNAATVGIGGGVGFDNSKIGGQAASLHGDSTVVAAYGSIAPVKNMFVDFVAGYGDLGFRTRRAINGAVATGSRDGNMWFGAVSTGIDRVDGDLRWSLYGRGEWLDGTLGAYAETGADIMDLRFDERGVNSLTGVLGGRFELNEPLTIGSFRPRVRVEWSHEFQDSTTQMLDYADIPGNAFYGITTEGWSRNQYEVALGGGLYTLSRWVFDVELGLRGASGERDGRFTVKLSREF